MKTQESTNSPLIRYPWLLDDNTLLISDTHFNHINIQRYCQRPDNWQEQLIRNWNAAIQNPQQIIFHLGDLIMGQSAMIPPTLNQLRGQIYLLLGNHDYRRPLPTRIKIVSQNLRADFGDFEILFSHEPVLTTDFPKSEKPLFNVHGHIHNNPTPEVEDLYHLNLSVEVTDYEPRSLGNIKKELQSRIAILLSKNL